MDYQALPTSYGAINTDTASVAFNDAEAYLVGGQPYTPDQYGFHANAPIPAQVAGPSSPFLWPPLEQILKDNWLLILIILILLAIAGNWIFDRADGKPR